MPVRRMAANLRPTTGTYFNKFLEHKMKPFSTWVSTGVVLLALLGGLGYIGFHVSQDLSNVTLISVWPWVLLWHGAR